MENNKHILITKACEYIENNLSEKITLAHLTYCTSYSERAIQLLFKKHFKLTPFEYIEEQRLLKAHVLIKQYKQSKKTTDIAREVGFRHLGRFSVNFKKRFGIHPSALARS